jgi:hypothetical protein
MIKKTIQFSTPQPILMKSILDLKRLHSPSSSDNYTKLTFFANDFCNLPDYLERNYQIKGVKLLSYDEALQLLFCLSEQLFHLENRGGSYLTIDPAKVFVVDDIHFIYLDDQVVILNKINNTIKIITPFSKNSLHLAPELKEADKLPLIISHKCIYYSAGSLLASCLIPLEQLKGTKLHSFLERCLEEDPAERTLLYI